MWDARAAAFLCCNRGCAVVFSAAMLPQELLDALRSDYAQNSAEKIQQGLNAAVTLAQRPRPTNVRMA